MDEEKTNRETEDKEPTPEDTGEGDKYETTPIIERAREEREKLEAANKKKEELLDREEAIAVKKELGGRSEAGQTAKKETEDEKWAKDAKERYAGTGMDPTPNEDGK